jgi:hypothetical protein
VWFSSGRTPTKRIEDRVTASQIAAAFEASFFCGQIPVDVSSRS